MLMLVLVLTFMLIRLWPGGMSGSHCSPHIPGLPLRQFTRIDVHAHSMLRAVLVCKSAGVWQALRQAGAVPDMPSLRGEFGPGELRREGAVAEHSWLSQS